LLVFIYLFVCVLFSVFISNVSCRVETTISIETVLLITLLLENSLMHLPNLVITVARIVWVGVSTQH